MIVYLDTSALVKQYIIEQHSNAVRVLIREQARIIGVAIIARPEFTATLARGMRTGLIWKNVAATALQRFRTDRDDLRVLLVTQEIIEEADHLAWTQNLRGCDAIHLATALNWQSLIGESITFVTFDKQLWQAARQVGLQVWPENLI